MQVLKQCIGHLRKKGRVDFGETFHTEAMNKHIVFAVCQVYIDGTLGEPDYLKQAYNSAFRALALKGVRKVAVGMDWLYPKQKFTKIIIDSLQLFSASFSEVHYYTLTDQTVMLT